MTGSSKKPAKNYHELSLELDTIITQLQREDVDIDEALKSYERGLTIIKQLEAYLEIAENKVTELRTKFANP